LESGDYALAVKSFTSVLKLTGTDGDAAELLRIAKDLQDRAKEAHKRASLQPVAGGSATSPPSAPTSEATPESRRAEPVKVKATPKPQPRPQAKRVAAVSARDLEQEEPAEGMLLVTSNPSGLLVEVDGRSMDLTPAKVRLEPGVHTVALLRGSQRLHERRVEIASDGVHSVDVDVSGALRAAQAFAREQRVVDDGELEPSDPERETPAPATSAPASQQHARTAAPAPSNPSVIASPGMAANTAAPTSFGDLHVVSPSIYGDVWINGRSYGPPPVLAKRVGVGTATVEIKVGGVARRTKTVDVVPNQRVTLRIR
jgi:hypothetical protein